MTPYICVFGFEGSADGSVSVQGGDAEQERTEVRPEHLYELDSAAQQVTTQEQGRGQRPGDLREQRQQGSQQVSHREVNQEHVHPGYLRREKESCKIYVIFGHIQKLFFSFKYFAC